MLESGKIKPVIYGTYRGLESVPSALDDLAARKVWGKAVVEIQTLEPQAKL
jgi:NADPH:quinone reductase